jgi:hypothetical protein
MGGEREEGKKMGEGEKIEEILKDGRRERRRKEKGGRRRRRERD